MGMAAGSVGDSGGRRRRGGRKHRPMSEINMTPFIDVMLVLLIIFMVSAPMMVVGVQVNLPKANAAKLNFDKKPLSVTIQGDGKILLMDKVMTLEELSERLTAIAKTSADEPIILRGDQNVTYGLVGQVNVKLQEAGFTKINLEFTRK